MNAPFRADQVGSLLRPAELSRARRQFKAGELEADALSAIEDRAIRKPCAGSRTSACKASPTASSGATGGTWTSWSSSTASRCRTTSDRSSMPSGHEQPPIATVTGKVACSKPIMVDDFAFLKSVTKAHAEDDDSFAIDAASARRPRRDLETRPTPIWPSSGPTLPRPTASPSAICTTPAAATCSSTTSPSPTCATRRSRPTAAPTAMIQPCCRASTPTPSTPRWPASPTTCA